MEKGEVVKMIMVTATNNNKYYIMEAVNDDNFKATWGRVQGDLNNIKEVGSRTKVYGRYEWDKIKNSKLKKGYKDVTKFYSEKIAVDDTGTEQASLDIAIAAIKKLVIDLQSHANVSIKENYTISARAVTQEMVDEAQEEVDYIIRNLKINADIEVLNEHLLKLFHVIPRKMARVQDYLFTEIEDRDDLARAQKKMGNEQDTLDVMAGQVGKYKKLKELEEQKKKDESDGKEIAKPINILEQLGLEIREVSDTEEAEVKKIFAGNAKQIKKVFAVENTKTGSAFEDDRAKAKDKKSELFFHGSRNQNWFNIISTGLLIRPAGAMHNGSMFGDGIYGANKAQKAINYTSLRGSYWTGGNSNQAFIALFEFRVGNQKHITRHSSSHYSLNKKGLSKEGFDSVYAHGGADLRNDEFIIYDASQCTIRYLVELG